MQSIPSFDLYRELEVDPAASAETIDAAWKSLLKRLHPDVAGDLAAAERVKRLNLAREWLADPDKRARYDRARRRPGVVVVPRTPAAPPPPTPPARARRPRYARILAPLAFASVIIVVAASSLIGSTRFPAAVAEASASPGPPASTAAASTQLGALASTAANPRGLPPPNLAAAIPTSCRRPRYEAAVTFEAQVRSAPGIVAVVGCDGNRSYGPMLFVAGADSWQLLASAGMHEGAPVGGFAGGVTGVSPDEFGIAWARGDGIRATITLYRMAGSLDQVWDSASIGLQWTMASFTYRASTGSTGRGSLVVIEADLTTGTAGCTTCHDHQMYREVYEWRSVTGRGQLVRTSREPYGIGPAASP